MIVSDATDRSSKMRTENQPLDLLWFPYKSSCSG